MSKDTKTMQIFIHRSMDMYQKEYVYSFFRCDMTDCGYTFVEQQELVIHLPPEDELVRQEIAILQEKKKAMQAAAQIGIEEVEAQIQSLLALPYLEGVK